MALYQSINTFNHSATSVLRQMLGKLIQDPHEEGQFEEGDVDVAEPVYAPLLGLVTTLYGETRTVVVSL